MITRENFFNNYTLNIFSDASILAPKEKVSGMRTKGCAGAIAVVNDEAPPKSIISSSTRLLSDTTNNEAEITAISLALDLAVQYKNNFLNINIFSDSKISIFALREWIFNWVRRTPAGSPLMGVSGDIVANQGKILACIYKILENNLSIRLYHQYGHVNTNLPHKLEEAKDSFIKVNNLMDDIDIDVIKSISEFNGYIDSYTRMLLNTSQQTASKDLISCIYKPFDIITYGRLIHVY